MDGSLGQSEPTPQGHQGHREPLLPRQGRGISVRRPCRVQPNWMDANLGRR